jgi:hypothetical protein
MEGISIPFTPAQMKTAGSTATGVERINAALQSDGYPREDGM